MTSTPAPRFIAREDARAQLTAKVETYTRAVADPKHFATTPPQVILEDAQWRLRWIDCAPEGANHQTAPMMDKTGTPMGGAWYEGPEGALSKAYREAVAQRGDDWITRRIAQHEARLEREAAEDRELGVTDLAPAEREAARRAHRRERFHQARRQARAAA